MSFKEDLLALGWWCRRCDVPAGPLPETWNHPATLDGWCMFCGMDPLVEGPAPVAVVELQGLRGLIEREG